ncbi:N-acetyl-gamma-glutamyl-phosphate reductase [Bacillus pinisoli]|uniref:N-acetyl-gamma-glutamyl-phosphate reductase n=1 Tax=Bacillus pinisoli TaxID=2901866 RepID=UPI001FF5483A|nr:N-acetyl-gamma-glutamyl-phosphate reductase [Bacillus pinisoli]
MKAAVIGGTGYSAIELIRLLHHHPYVELEAIVSHSKTGQDLKDIYPHLTGVITTPLAGLETESICERADVVFFATPSGVSKDLLPGFLDKGVTCIDLSGDFRLRSRECYETWYRHEAADEHYISQAVYGLSERYKEAIQGAAFVSNPGCYPTATLLALIPAMQNKLINHQSIIIDAKSGVSGAGRGLSLGTHYGEINENLRAYKLGAHQHIPEIEQVLQDEVKAPVTVSFSTHLVPMTRGIMCTIYAELNEYKTSKELIELYKSHYENNHFVRIREEGIYPSTKEVYGSNYCDIGIHADERTGRVVFVSVIDNLVKGASGQAVQNLNILNGWDETSGLLHVPMYP